jgi:hypothetical protein
MMLPPLAASWEVNKYARPEARVRFRIKGFGKHHGREPPPRIVFVVRRQPDQIGSRRPLPAVAVDAGREREVGEGSLDRPRGFIMPRLGQTAQRIGRQCI